MNRIATGLLATVLSVSFAAAAAVPADAATVYVPQAQAPAPTMQAVDYKPWMKNRGGDWRRGGDRRHFERRNGDVYWNGHRGYRDYHRGYRRNGDYWFPLAAFAAGALISGAIVNSQQDRVYEGGNAHVRWCYNRYKSYRASDNTFQPYNGPRQQCRSPY